VTELCVRAHGGVGDERSGATATRQDGDWWTALRGWLLLAVALVVVFFAAGGFAVTNLSAGVEARAERQTAEIVLAQRRLDTVTTSRLAECTKRGSLCRSLEAQEQVAIAELGRLQADVKADADPQAAAFGISLPGCMSSRLRDGGAVPVLRPVHQLRGRTDLEGTGTLMTNRRHPHEGRIAEVYRRGEERLIFVRYTEDRPPNATWDKSLMGWVLDSETGN
jgi:hypothetical protein